MTQNNFGRRELLIASLTAGFAMAVQPISAQVINTKTRGLVRTNYRLLLLRRDIGICILVFD